MVALLEKTQHHLYICDNLDNSSLEALTRITSILVPNTQNRVTVLNADLFDIAQTEKVVFQTPGVQFDACIHFAGLKAVGESVKVPLMYYGNNVSGTINLLSLLNKYKCFNLVFSSSATVYGEVAMDAVPIPETAELKTFNPYGSTKVCVYERDVAYICVCERDVTYVCVCLLWVHSIYFYLLFDASICSSLYLSITTTYSCMPLLLFTHMHIITIPVHLIEYNT